MVLLNRGDGNMRFTNLVLAFSLVGRVDSGKETGDTGYGIDNDGDGTIDGDDLGCASAMDNTEDASVGSCEDNIDNDGDGFPFAAHDGVHTPG